MRQRTHLLEIKILCDDVKACSPPFSIEGEQVPRGRVRIGSLVDGNSHQEIVGIRDIHEVESGTIGRDLD